MWGLHSHSEVKSWLGLPVIIWLSRWNHVNSANEEGVLIATYTNQTRSCCKLTASKRFKTQGRFQAALRCYLGSHCRNSSLYWGCPVPCPGLYSPPERRKGLSFLNCPSFSRKTFHRVIMLMERDEEVCFLFLNSCWYLDKLKQLPFPPTPHQGTGAPPILLVSSSSSLCLSAAL